MGKSIIEIKHYNFVYEGTEEKVLEDVSSTIEEGDFMGTISCNRASKTILCQSIVGILPFTTGGGQGDSITADGRNLNDSGGRGVAGIIGIIFRDAESRLTQETVEGELAFAVYNFGYEGEVMGERILYAPKACGLEDMLNRSSLKLSGGQQQRLATACILVLRPRVIVPDESIFQLDPLGRDEVFQLVTKLYAKGATVVMVDRNIEKIAGYADKVLVLHEGKVVAYDDTHKVFQQRELLQECFVRVLQVTGAALRMEEQPGTSRAPIELETARRVFVPLRGDMRWRKP